MYALNFMQNDIKFYGKYIKFYVHVHIYFSVTNMLNLM